VSTSAHEKAEKCAKTKLTFALYKLHCTNNHTI